MDKFDIIYFIELKNKLSKIPFSDKKKYIPMMIEVNQLRSSLKNTLMITCKICNETAPLIEFLDDIDSVRDRCIECRRLDSIDIDEFLLSFTSQNDVYPKGKLHGHLTGGF